MPWKQPARGIMAAFSSWRSGVNPDKGPVVSVVKLSGVIAAPAPGASALASRRILNADRCETWFNKAFSKLLRPAAVALVINSPGGSPVQSDLIYQMVRAKAKATGLPVYTFAEDVAASGGYWLLSAGDQGKVYSCSTSLVGSIGVISAQFGLVDAIGKLGIERRVYTAGRVKAGMDPFRAVTPEEEAVVRDLLENLHVAFKQHVREARGAALKANDDALFSGRVWTGQQAKDLGLVDNIGNVRATMQQQFGQQVQFVMCNDRPATSVLSALGLQRQLPGALTRLRGLLPQQLQALLPGHAAAAARQAAAEFAPQDTDCVHGTTGRSHVSAQSDIASRLIAGLQSKHPEVLVQAAVSGLLDELEYRAAWAPYALH